MKTRNTKWIAYLGMIALLASLIVGLFGFSNMTREIEHIKDQLLTRHVENNINLTLKYLNRSYGTLTQGEGTLLDKNGQSIEGTFGMVDSIMEDLGDQSTIFVKVNDDFKRISTNILDDKDERAIGTFLGKDHNAYHTVMNGDLYVGQAEILGENFYAAYKPIKDQNNNVIGLLFVGIPTESLDSIIEVHDEKLDRINIAVIVLRTISLGALILLVSRSLLDQRAATKKE